MHYSLYFHIPFCVHRCAYCDFNTYAGQETLIPDYVDALCREIRYLAESAPQRLTAHTLFFGGGTPSLLSSFQFETILKVTRDCFDLTQDAEISLEANPGTVSFDSLRDLHGFGFNGPYQHILSFNGKEGFVELDAVVNAIFDITNVNILGITP